MHIIKKLLHKKISNNNCVKRSYFKKNSNNCNFKNFNDNYFKKNNNHTLQYISDLHLEYREELPIIPPVSENLALLGDIGNPFNINYNQFIKYASNNWNNVFLITGNHEYWQEKYNIQEVNDKIKNITSTYNNVHFLNNETFQLNNFVICGTTLWSRILARKDIIMGDDLYIKYNTELITHAQINQIHQESVDWLKNTIHQSIINKKQLLVLTHHLPSYELIVDQFKTGRFAKYHDRFASDLDYLIKDPVKVWLCGHSHITIEKDINNVLVAINAFGHKQQSDKKRVNDVVRTIDFNKHFI